MNRRVLSFCWMLDSERELLHGSQLMLTIEGSATGVVVPIQDTRGPRRDAHGRILTIEGGATGVVVPIQGTRGPRRDAHGRVLACL